MANLADWVEEEAAGEAIEAIVIGDMGWRDAYGSENVSTWATQRRHEVLSWTEARPMLDYEFSDGYGAPKCNALFAWTATRVIAVSQYDGSTTPFSLPRNPTNLTEPFMPGGG